MSNQQKEMKQRFKYCPMSINELPLTIRLYADPLLLTQSLNRQKASIKRIQNMESCIDNKLSKSVQRHRNMRKLRLKNIKKRAKIARKQRLKNFEF